MNIMIFIYLSYVHNRYFPSLTLFVLLIHIIQQGLTVRRDECLYICYVHIVDSSLPLNQWFICRVAMIWLVAENILQKWRALRGCVQLIYLYILNMYIFCTDCWFFRDYVFNDVGYVIIKGGEVRKWFFEDIYIYTCYI